jgi:hypothetical protein
MAVSAPVWVDGCCEVCADSLIACPHHSHRSWLGGTIAAQPGWGCRARCFGDKLMALITINRNVTISCAEHGPAEVRSRTGPPRWWGRAAIFTAIVAAVGLTAGVASSLASPASTASTTNVSFIPLTTPYQLFTAKAFRAQAIFHALVLGGATTVPTNATTVQLHVEAGGTAAGTMSFYPTGDPSGGSGQSLSWSAGSSSTATIEENVGLGDDLTFKNRTSASTATATITGYSTQVTDADVAPADGLNGQVLTNTGSGAQWETVNTTSSPWEFASAPTVTIIDGTQLQLETISAPSITATALADSSISIYMTFGGNEIPLPYTSFAGGKANTISYQLVPGQIIITRFTHDDSATIGFSAALQFRYVITTATGPGVGVQHPPARQARGHAGSAGN